MGIRGGGVMAALAASTIWGLSPLYFGMLNHVPAPELLAHRICWGALFVGGFCLLTGRGPRIAAALRDRRAVGALALSALLISVNWITFLSAVQAGRVTEAGLGYYLMPLVSVGLAVVLLCERLGVLQWAAVGLAVVAVGLLGIGLGAPPVVPLLLAFSFAFYGYLRKRIGTGAIVGFQVEVLLLLPIALGWIGFVHARGGGAFGADAADTALLVLAGPMTGLPLVLFAEAARRLPYATAGLIQYINPTLQVGAAALVLGEPFTPWHLGALALIWTGLALYSVALWRAPRGSAAATAASAASGVPTTVR